MDWSSNQSSGRNEFDVSPDEVQVREKLAELIEEIWEKERAEERLNGWVPVSWLGEKVSLAEIEREKEAKGDRSFWNKHKELGILIDSMGASDELWSFRSPAESWSMLHGSEGYAVVREGKPIDGFVTIYHCCPVNF